MKIEIEWEEIGGCGEFERPFLELVPETPEELLTVRAVVRRLPGFPIQDGFSLGAVRLGLYFPRGAGPCG